MPSIHREKKGRKIADLGRLIDSGRSRPALPPTAVRRFRSSSSERVRMCPIVVGQRDVTRPALRSVTMTRKRCTLLTFARVSVHGPVFVCFNLVETPYCLYTSQKINKSTFASVFVTCIDPVEAPFRSTHGQTKTKSNKSLTSIFQLTAAGYAL